MPFFEGYGKRGEERFNKLKAQLGAPDISLDNLPTGGVTSLAGAIRGAAPAITSLVSKLSPTRPDSITPLRGALSELPAIPVPGQASKDIVRKMLLKDFADKATEFAFRGTNLDELRHIAHTGRLSLGKSAEGVPGISASTITKDGLPIYGDGIGYIAKAGQYSPSGRFGEVLVDEKVSPKTLQFVVGDRVIDFEKLRAMLK